MTFSDGSRVKMTAKGVKWATTKTSKTIGIDWNKRVGTVMRQCKANKTEVFVLWDTLIVAKAIPQSFLREVYDRPNQGSSEPAAPSPDQGC